MGTTPRKAASPPESSSTPNETELPERWSVQRKSELLHVPYTEIVRSRILTLMSPDELRTLADANIEVELHTHRHTFPPDSRVTAEREVADNRAALGEWLEGEKRHFCYPSGVWDGRQWSWLDAMRVRSSTTCLAGLNDQATPRHALRRFLDSQSIDQVMFEAAVSGFLASFDRLRGRQ